MLLLRLCLPELPNIPLIVCNLIPQPSEERGQRQDQASRFGLSALSIAWAFCVLEGSRWQLNKTTHKWPLTFLHYNFVISQSQQPSASERRAIRMMPVGRHAPCSHGLLTVLSHTITAD